ncbi:Aldehyde dehydrogenase [Apophysomyces sp. BC1034]|nr:Aldehyde dehydrogenase [Apophysomyces sp. BC1015]KAG0182279.1 Aldehyde dehydrogenase [Apophysomyces sp. BC1021]KAG0192898.1 Aldehyde dehydrogenase [Apophysomyces sp. BC1034]
MASLTYTSLDIIEDNVQYVRQIFNIGKPRDMTHRKTQLQNLYLLVKNNEERFYQALAQDMNKPRNEAFSGDICPVLEECLYFLENVDKLAKDEKVKPRQMMNCMEKLSIRKDPLGTVLIIGCWNYPVQLSLVPLAGAIAAGNSVILKLSEISSHTSALITELFPKYMDTNCYRLVNGAVEETTALLRHRFDHIFYTGNSTVGKIVMEAASKHLTPVTLELGGKSPAIITPDADMQLTANRIAFGKLYNCGQICIAVDYVLCPKPHVDEFVNAFRKTVKEWYGNNPKESSNYARIVSVRHVDRIAAMLNNRRTGEIALGGEIDRNERYIAPTVVTEVAFNDEVLMGDEIFGPILPVITYNNLDEAIGIVNQNPPPLVLYVFSRKQKLTDKVLNHTQSGGVCINDCLMHQAEYALPFGGVGNSGMGNYHGPRSFRTFTHERSVMAKKQQLESLISVRYPPYTSTRVSILRALMLTHPAIVWLKRYRGPLKTLVILFILVSLYVKKSV